MERNDSSKRNIRWDEENLNANEAYAKSHPKTKIDEPKTPYQIDSSEGSTTGGSFPTSPSVDFVHRDRLEGFEKLEEQLQSKTNGNPSLALQHDQVSGLVSSAASVASSEILAEKTQGKLSLSRQGSSQKHVQISVPGQGIVELGLSREASVDSRKLPSEASPAGSTVSRKNELSQDADEFAKKRKMHYANEFCRPGKFTWHDDDDDDDDDEDDNDDDDNRHNGGYDNKEDNGIDKDDHESDDSVDENTSQYNNDMQSKMDGKSMEIDSGNKK